MRVSNIHNKRFVMPLWLVIVKVLYIWLVIVALPEVNMRWSFDKNINLENICFEIIPFLVGVYTFMRGFYKSNAYTFMSTLVFITLFIPANSGLVLSSNDADYYFLTNAFFILLIAILSNIARKSVSSVNAERTLQYDVISSSKRFIWTIRILMIFISLVTIGYVYKYNGLNFLVMFSEMYETRAEYAAYAVEIQGGLVSYATLIITKTASWMLPLYLYYALKTKSPIDIVISLFTIVANFTMEMQKSFLFLPITAAVIVFYEGRNKLNSISSVFIKGFVLLLSVSVVEFYLFGESQLFIQVIKRITYVPTYLFKVYFDFYKVNPKILFTDDCFVVQWIMRLFLGRPYTGSSVSVISEHCFNGWLTSPNTGIFAEAYAQLGVIGIFVFPWLYAYITKKTIDKASIYGSGAVLVVLVKLAFVFLNNFVLATANVIGLLMFFILAFLVRVLIGKNNVKKQDNN